MRASAPNTAPDGGSVTSSLMGSELGDADVDGDNPESDGDMSTTPIINMNVGGTHFAGGTPIVPTPPSASGAATNPFAPPPPPHGTLGSNIGHVQSGLSFAQVVQSPPSAHPLGQPTNPPWQLQTSGFSGTGGGSNLSQSAPAATGPFFWASTTSSHVLGGAGNHSSGGVGLAGAQHVTGMMGAAALDEVDEGDEAFGDGSEIIED